MHQKGKVKDYQGRKKEETHFQWKGQGQGLSREKGRGKLISNEKDKPKSFDMKSKGLGTCWDHVLHQSKMWWIFCKSWFCWSLKSIWNNNNQVAQDCKSCHAIHFTLTMGMRVKTSGACFMVISKWFTTICKALVTMKFIGTCLL